MELLQGFIQPPKAQSAEETIPTLCDRVENAALISDRRSAVLGLKGFSREYRETVIASGLKPLINTLKRDFLDEDSVKAILETLLILFIRGEGSDDLTRNWISQQSRLQNGKYPSPLVMKQEHESVDQFSLWIADALTQTNEIVHLFFQLIDTGNFHIRLYTIQLLEAVLSTRPSRTREAIITLPVGVSTLVCLLDDVHEPVRDEVILLLMAIVNDSTHIQKLVAFENIFERLFSIIQEEGGIRGSIVVNDCLSLINNILKYNTSNQTLFLETGNLPQLAALLNEPFSDEEEFFWNNQRIINIKTGMDILRLIVEPGNSATPKHQRALLDSHVLMIVLRLAFYAKTPNSVRPMALLTAADIIRDNSYVQQEFGKIDVPFLDPSLPMSTALDNPPLVSVLSLLLNWSLFANSVHTFDIRISSIALLKAYFNENHELKKIFIEQEIAQYKLINNTIEDGSDFVLRTNVFETIMDYDPDLKLNPYKLFFATDLLMYLFQSESSVTELRDLARKLNSGNDSAGEEVLSSIQTICELLLTTLSTEDARIPISYLSFLIFWLFEDVKAVDDFLSNRSIVYSLIAFSSQIEDEDVTVKCLITILLGVAYEFSSKESPFPREELYELLTKSIGTDNYSSRVKQFKETSLFSKAKDNDEGIFTPEFDDTGLPKIYFSTYFIRLFKENFYRIQSALRRGPEDETSGKISFEIFDDLKQQYSALEKELKSLEGGSEATITELEEKVKNLDRKCKELEADLNKSTTEHTQLNERYESVKKDLELTAEKVAALNNEKRDLLSLKEKYEDTLTDNEASLSKNKDLIQRLKADLGNMTSEKQKAEDGINKMSRELFTLTKEKQDLENEINKSGKENEQRLQKFKKDEKRLSEGLAQKDAEVKKLQEFVTRLQNQIQELETSKNKLSSELNSLRPRFESHDALIPKLTEKLKSLAKNFKQLEQEKELISQELVSKGKFNDEEISSLKSEISALASEIETLVGQKEDFEKKVTHLGQEVASKVKLLQDSKVDHDSEVSSLQKTIDSLNAQVKTISESQLHHSSRREQAEKKIASLDGEFEKLELSVTKLNKLLISKDEELQSTKGIISGIEGERDANQMLLSETKAKLDELQKKFDDLQTKHLDTSEKMKEVQKELRIQGGEHQKMIKKMEKQLKEISIERDQKEKVVTELRTKLETVCAELNASKEDRKEESVQLMSEIDTLKSKILALEEEKSSIERSCDSYRTQRQNDEVELKDLRSEMTTLQDSLSSAKNEMNSAKDLSLHLQNDTKDLNDRILELEAEIKNKNENISAYEKSKLAIEKEKTNLKTELQSLENKSEKEASVLKSEIQKLKDEMKNKVQDFEKERKMLNEGSTSITQGYSEKVTALELKLSNTEAELSAKIKSLERTNADLDEKLRICEEKLEEKEVELCSLKEKESNVLSSLDLKESEINALKDSQTREITALNNKIKELSGQINIKEEELKSKNNDISTLNMSAKANKESIGGLKKQLEELQARYSDLEETSTRELQSLKETLGLEYENKETQQRQLDEMKDSVNQKDETIESLTSKCSELKFEKEKSEKTSLELKELESKHNRYMNDLETCNKAKTSLLTEIETIRNQKNNLSEELLKNQKQYKENEDSLQKIADENARRINLLEEELANLKEDTMLWKSKAEDRSEVDDLMLLVTELDEANKKYREKLKGLGEELTSDEEEDSDEDEN